MIASPCPTKDVCPRKSRTVQRRGPAVRARGERALTASLGGEFEAIFVRAQDIPEFVADGAADAGVTGWDLVLRDGPRARRLLDLGSAAAGWCGRARGERSRRLDGPARGTRAWPPRSPASPARSSGRGSAVEVVPVSGAAEIAPHLGIADVVVDLTSTGSTLR